MLFSSITFLYLFLPLVLIVYYLVPAVRWRNAVLLIASLVFYFAGEPVYTVLLLLSSLSDYFHSLYIEKHRGTRRAKVALMSSIVINLGLLGFFKYADFFIGLFNALTGASVPLLKIPLPIGISFFTFQTMSYTIDVYRGEVHAQRNLATLGTYVCLFPQLVAGPIVRYSTIAEELECRTHSAESAAAGLRRFVVGLAKKVLIANAMGELCTLYRSAMEPSVLYTWIYAAAYTLQIYFDFSGYSDMAIGLGQLFGFHFLENFNYPYISRSVTEFWRRWHMSLSTWFRDYVYIPLGGNRVSRGKHIRNILVVWFLTGFWHGAAWNFLLWGGFFGLILILEKFVWDRWLKRMPGVFCWVYTMLLVILSFVLFNATGLDGALTDLRHLFGGLPLSSAETLYQLRNYGLLLVLAAIGATPLVKRGADWLSVRCPRGMLVLEPLVLAVLLLVVTAYLVDGSFNPFLYFRF